MSGKKWFVIGGCVLVALTLWACRMWILIRVFPGAVLTLQVQETLRVLEERFSDDSLQWLRDSLPKNNSQLIRARIAYDDPGRGETQWTMNLQLQSRPPRLTGEGDFTVLGRSTSLALYLDEECAALRPPGAPEEKWYGIAYDAFAQSMEGNKMLELFLGSGKRQVLKWVRSPNKIPALPEVSIPAIPWEDIRNGAAALLLLPYEVSRSEEGYWLHTELSGEQLIKAASAAEKYGYGSIIDSLNTLGFSQDTKITGNILMKDFRISAFCIVLSLENQTLQLVGKLDQDMSRGGATLELWHGETGDEEKMTLEINSRQEEGERGSVSFPSGERLKWNLNCGKPLLSLQWTDQTGEESIDVQVCGTSEGLQILAPKAGPLVAKLTGWDFPNLDRWGKGEFIIGEGVQVTPPAYRDFSLWSLEEFLGLLEAVEQIPGNVLG